MRIPVRIGENHWRELLINEPTGPEVIGATSAKCVIQGRPLDRPWCIHPKVTVSFDAAPRPRRLPRLVQQAVDLAIKDDQAGLPLTHLHVAELLVALGWTVEAGPGAAVLNKLLAGFNDLQRGVPSPMFQPAQPPGTDGPKETVPTDELNFMRDAAFAVDLTMMLEKQRRREVIDRVRRCVRQYLPHRPRGHLEEFRHNWARKNDRRARAGAVLRKELGLPKEAGETPEARLEWLLARLERAVQERTVVSPSID